MASTVFHLTVRLLLLTLTFATTTFPAWADQIPTYRLLKEKLITKTTATPSRYNESRNVADSKYEEESRNYTAVTPPNDELGTVTSESTSTATRFSDEDVSEIDLDSVVTLVAQYQPEDVTEVYRPINEQPAEISTPASADTQPTTETPSHLHSDHGETPVAAVPPTPSRHTPTPDDDAVSHLWSISADVKGQRLIQVAKEGRMEEVKTLLASGAYVGARDGNYFNVTALHWAAAKGYMGAVRSLLGAGADVDARDRTKGTPLHVAAEYGRTAVLRVLLESAADIDARDEDGWTPLHYTAYRGHTEVAAVLLEAGADRGARDNDGCTALHFARQGNHQQLIHILS